MVTILAVSDEPFELAVYRVLLGSSYILLTASNAEEALGILKGEASVDLLVCDYRMSTGIDGIELIRQVIKVRQGGIPAILTTYEPEERLKPHLEALTKEGAKVLCYDRAGGAEGLNAVIGRLFGVQQFL